MSSIEITPVTAAIGAEVRGVDLREELSDVDVKVIRQALLDHLVVFFRDQHITDEQQLAFALRFGPMHVSPLQTVHQERAISETEARNFLHFFLFGGGQRLPTSRGVLTR